MGHGRVTEVVNSSMKDQHCLIRPACPMQDVTKVNFGDVPKISEGERCII